jgi:valyl-tRNA synthetase
MDPAYSESVIDVFIDLYKKGKIYRGVRMVNWDPEALTAVSDEEVLHKEVNSKLYFVRYKIKDSTDEWVTIATTRPETILGDSAVCVNPDDERYSHLKGKKVIVPIANRVVPIISDEYVDMEFGTGCLKITPAHDVNDYEIGKKHGLETIDVFEDNGQLNAHGLHYAGQDRFAVRKAIEKELHDKGYLLKTEDHINKVGYSERTNAVIEPKLSLQWFVSMKELSQPAMENVMNGNIQFHPDKFKNTYRHWMENIKDWCISRQLWWGHRIPAWYYGQGPDDYVVAKTREEAVEEVQNKTSSVIRAEDLRQDEDVLDTWFSSWLWPISVFNGLTDPGNKDIKYYYPTNDLVTAPEIMFFWVARMIIAGYEYMGEMPFKNVYYTGIVRDKLGRKMSKSLGNSPDPLDLIEQYGADGVRLGILISSPAGNDLPFDSGQCEQGRNFTNKIWNAYRLVSSWETIEMDQPTYAISAISWFEARFQQQLKEINDLFSKFRISEALMSTYKLIWDDFCSWYLEIVKPGYQQPIDIKTKSATTAFFEKLMQLLHPFMPFISEEIWHLLKDRKDGEDIIVSHWPETTEYDQHVLVLFEHAQEVVTGIRNVRKENNIATKVKMELWASEGNNKQDKSLDAVIIKLGNITQLEYTDESKKRAHSFLSGTTVYYLPFGDSIDVESERKKHQEEIDYLKGFLKSVQAKLSNERFMAGAPEQVVSNERKKESDALEKIRLLEEKLSNL